MPTGDRLDMLGPNCHKSLLTLTNFYQSCGRVKFWLSLQKLKSIIVGLNQQNVLGIGFYDSHFVYEVLNSNFSVECVPKHKQHISYS